MNFILKFNWHRHLLLLVINWLLYIIITLIIRLMIHQKLVLMLNKHLVNVIFLVKLSFLLIHTSDWLIVAWYHFQIHRWLQKHCDVRILKSAWLFCKSIKSRLIVTDHWTKIYVANNSRCLYNWRRLQLGNFVF